MVRTPPPPQHSQPRSWEAFQVSSALRYLKGHHLTTTHHWVTFSDFFVLVEEHVSPETISTPGMINAPRLPSPGTGLGARTPVQ